MRKNLYSEMLGFGLATFVLMSCEKEEMMQPDLAGIVSQHVVSENCYIIDFEQYTATDPEDLPFITEVTGAYGTVGVYNTRRTELGEWQNTNVARIYDTAKPTGDDAHDLGKPTHLGKMLIANQYTEAEITANPDGTDGINGRIAGPNDNAWGAKMALDFSTIDGAVTMYSITVVDIDESPRENASYVELTTASGDKVRFDLETSNTEGHFQVVDLEGTKQVVKLEVVFDGEGNVGSGAIDNINFCIERTTYGCTLTQGYWKTHASGKKYDKRWGGMENTTFYSSEQTYLEVLKTAPKGGNAYYILAHQFIAAKLNMQGASSTPEVTEAFNNAAAYFGTSTPKIPYTTVERAQLIEWAETLAAYNEGKIGPGHCD